MFVEVVNVVVCIVEIDIKGDMFFFNIKDF